VTLQGQIEKIDAQITEAKADLRLSERDKRAAEALQSMKRLYGSAVRGRLSDLCQPTQRKYQLAVTVAMGKNFDAIVVEDDKTAKDCIQVRRCLESSRNDVEVCDRVFLRSPS
jgi:structural maintenance of chromosome 1